MTKCGNAVWKVALGAAIAVAACCLVGITGLAKMVLVQTPNAAINNKTFPIEDLQQTLECQVISSATMSSTRMIDA
jgi:hypothetical protein